MSKKKYYAVRKGRKPGIYTDWFGPEGAEAQVKGFNGAQFKGFSTLADAKNWLGSDMNIDQTITKVQSLPQENLEIAEEGTTLDIDPIQALADGKVILYTDGACEGNPGPGGYGVVLLYKGKRKEYSNGYRLTTNNCMELMACIIGLEALKIRSEVVLYSDSQYVVNGIRRGWAKRWRDHDWMRNKREKAENTDLWSRLLDLCEQHTVQFSWVRGHSGNRENERCDHLSVQAIRQPSSIDKNYESQEH